MSTTRKSGLVTGGLTAVQVLAAVATQDAGFEWNVWWILALVFGLATLVLIFWPDSGDTLKSQRVKADPNSNIGNVEMVGRDKITNVGWQASFNDPPKTIDLTVTASNQPIRHSTVFTKQLGQVMVVTVPNLTIDRRSDYAPQLEFKLEIGGQILDGLLMNELYPLRPSEFSFYFDVNPKEIDGAPGQTQRHLGFASYELVGKSVPTDGILRFRDVRGDKGKWWNLHLPGGEVSTKQ